MKIRKTKLTFTFIIVVLIMNSTHGFAVTTQEILQNSGVKGGVVVRLGCSNPKRLTDLYADGRYLVHGLDTDTANVEKVRNYIQSRDLAGNISVDVFDGTNLPYVDNLVNLIVADELGKVSMDEVMRVLAPLGVAYIGPKKTVKPWPAEIDEWTHFLHGPDNNAVAMDTQVNTPRHLKWSAPPRRTRDHDAQGSLSAMTSSRGRLFYIIDEGPTSMIHRPADWKLIARDAFNGMLLWKRKIPAWIGHLRFFRSGPTQLTRRLVSIDDSVYVTLGLDALISVLDAASGQTTRTFPGSENTEEFIIQGNTLLAVIGKPELWNKIPPFMNDSAMETLPDKREDYISPKKITAYDTASGKILWETSGRDLSRILPLSLTTGGDSVFYMDHEHVYALDIKTGQEQWRAPFKTPGLLVFSKAPTVVYSKNTLLVQLFNNKLSAFSADNGKQLWEMKGIAFTDNSPPDLFVIGDLLWSNSSRGNFSVKDLLGIDIRTGEIKRRISKKKLWPGGHHHRCYRNKATQNYIITSRRGTEFLDIENESSNINWWLRGLCQYGMLPANGMLYVPPNPCGCFAEIMFHGLNGFSHKNSLDDLIKQFNAERENIFDIKVTKGKQAEKKDSRFPVWQGPIYDAGSGDWPTYRHDITRSGFSPVPVPVELKQKWELSPGGNLTSSTVKNGRLYVGSVDRNMLYCINADTGKHLWTYTMGAGMDSPPTLYKDMALFGCKDGFVYALNAENGSLVWRFQAGPTKSYLISYDRLESVWPIHGSVLILDGVLYFAAGRTAALDGGLYLYGLDPSTGKVLQQKRLTAGKGNTVRNAFMPDVLVSDGKGIVMRKLRFIPSLEFDRTTKFHTTLNSPTGLLEDVWAHRANWNLGPILASNNPRVTSGISGVNAEHPFGKLIVFNDKTAYALQTPYTFRKLDHSTYPEGQSIVRAKHQNYARYKKTDFPTGCRFFSQSNEKKTVERTGRSWENDQRLLTLKTHNWTKDLPCQFRAMVVAGDKVLLAGWKDSVNIDGSTKENEHTFIQARSTENGEKLAEYVLPAKPVFDGLIAANGRLYISLANGKIMCFGK